MLDDDTYADIVGELGLKRALAAALDEKLALFRKNPEHFAALSFVLAADHRDQVAPADFVTDRLHV